MPSAFRDPKNLSEWIELDYFRRSRLLWWLRKRATWLTLLGCVLLVVVAVVLPRTSRLYQAGPVSTAHAMFNDDCAQCHRDNFRTASRFLPWNASVRAVDDAACTRCHDGPLHNEEQTSTPHCAGCHREHRGRVALARLPDSQCLACHQDLQASCKHPDRCRFQDIGARGFPDGHPEFALWLPERASVAVKGKDPGKIRFNHKVHLKPEGVLRLLPVTGLEGPGARKEYEHLHCGACHKADPAGRYMLPISYEDHCKRCHPLSVQITGTIKDARARTAADAFARDPAPHPKPGQTAESVRAALRERFLRFVQQNPLVLAGPEAEPVRTRVDPRSGRAITEQQWLWARQELSESERLLFVNAQEPQAQRMLNGPGGCTYCHLEKGPRSGDLPEYEKPNIPQRWLPHSRFSHESHRMLDCAECHAAGTSSKTEDVLMPHQETCARCHTPAAGAPSDCVECHAYHDRNKAREPHNRTIADCLGK